MTASGLLLNIGSGDHRAPEPWVNVDSYAGTNPDVVADIRSLPFDDDSADAVYCGHVLEHLTFNDVAGALTEVRRVLRGRACFVGPDLDRAIAYDEDPILIDLIRNGGDRWPGDRHQWASTGATALSLIRDVFPDAHEVDVTQLDAFWPLVAPARWQFAIVTEGNPTP